MAKSDDIRTAALLERLGRLVQGEAHVAGLQPVQWEVLRYLERANRFSRTAAAVTSYLGLTKGTVSQTLMALEAKGLIRKQVNPKDRRSNRLALTAKAKRLLSEDPLGETQAALSKLPEKTRKALEGGLEALLTERLLAQGRQPFGQCSACVHFARRHHEGEPHYCELLKERLSKEDAQAICVEQVAG